MTSGQISGINGCRRGRIKRNLRLRARVLRLVRQFFEMNDYLEVETPVRIPTQAPEVHIDAVSSDGQFLQTSPEICMKRLLAAGYKKIFQICKCFRHNERGRYHLPEMTLLEWYRAGVDYRAIMQETQNLVLHVADNLKTGRKVRRKDETVSLRAPWDRLSLSDAFARYAKISAERAIAEDRFDEILSFQIEPYLGIKKPVFLCDYPAQTSALARCKRHDQRFAERFELYISGLELCNAFSELTDPREQRKRFEKELSDRKKLGKTLYPMPEIFLTSLENMPEAAGCAFGIDRFVMLFANADRIDDVVSFTPEEL